MNYNPNDIPMYYEAVGIERFVKQPFMTQQQANQLHQQISPKNAEGLLGVWIVTIKDAHDGEFGAGQKGYIAFVDTSLIDPSEACVYGFWVRFNNGKGSTLFSHEFEVLNEEV